MWMESRLRRKHSNLKRLTIAAGYACSQRLFHAMAHAHEPHQMGRETRIMATIFPSLFLFLLSYYHLSFTINHITWRNQQITLSRLFHPKRIWLNLLLSLYLQVLLSGSSLVQLLYTSPLKQGSLFQHLFLLQL